MKRILRDLGCVGLFLIENWERGDKAWSLKLRGIRPGSLRLRGKQRYQGGWRWMCA